MINNVVIFGRLTADVELRVTSNNIAFCNFSIANETGYGDNKKTNFFRCTAWRGTAEAISKYLCKGSQVGLQGQLIQNSYEDKNGNKRDNVEILVENIQFCDSAKSAQNGPNNAEDLGTLNYSNGMIDAPKTALKAQETANGYTPYNSDEFVPF